ncbi:MAG: hypothetical protein RIQ60_726 [Pseudomonadota bacterium]|jgi:hypothetical protein
MTLSRALAFLCRCAHGLTLAGLLVLAACGGNVSRVQPFAPTNFASFGDELSVVTGTGTKYSINVFATDSTGTQLATYNCLAAPTWNQVVASSFGFAYAECPNGATTFNAKLMAAEKATVADVVTQVATYRNTVRAFDSKTLVTLMAGVYDIKNAYEAYALVGTANALSTAKSTVAAAGVQLGQLVNDIAAGGAGGRVVYSTVPDIGYSPYAIAKGAAGQQVLHDLTRAFNDAFELTVINDGRYTGLVFPTAETTLRAMALADVTNNTLGLTDVTTPACTVALPNCDTKTLTDSATGTNGNGSTATRLWADDLRPGPAWHAAVGSNADVRARANPF